MQMWEIKQWPIPGCLLFAALPPDQLLEDSFLPLERNFYLHQHQEVISHSQYLQLQGRGHFYKNNVSPGNRTIKNDREHVLYYGNLTLQVGSWLTLDVVLYCFCVCGWD